MLLAPPLAAAIQIFFDELADVSSRVVARPGLEQLRERLLAARVLIENEGGRPTPEVASLVERLEQLMEEVDYTLQSRDLVDAATGVRHLAVATKK